MLISVLHNKGRQSSQKELDEAAKGGFASLVPEEPSDQADVSGAAGTGLTSSIPAESDERGEQRSLPPSAPDVNDVEHGQDSTAVADNTDWSGNMRLLLQCFLVSGLYTVCTYFFPILRNLPIFGTTAANVWLWTLNPSLAYVGQGIIMGVETTTHMTIGAILGWAVLSPLAKFKGWAPGPVDDWEHGSKGWIVWVSLAIMLVDAVVSLAYVAFRPLFGDKMPSLLDSAKHRILDSKAMRFLRRSSGPDYAPVREDDEHDSQSLYRPSGEDHTVLDGESEDDGDAPPEQRISARVVSVGLVSSILLCVATIHLVFGDLVPLYATVIAVLMALVLSIMGVRALGETDLNPVSGISKLAQLFFALIIPQSNPSSVLINLVAGAVVRNIPIHVHWIVQGC